MTTADEKVISMLSYNHSTGAIVWASHQLSRKIGSNATRTDKNGHEVVRYSNKSWMAHRIAWRLYYGSWPVNCIDHVNGLRGDNRIENLRDVTLSVNQQNRKGRTVRNKYDVPMGVTFYSTRKTAKPWIAKITIAGKSTPIGYFSTKEEAGEAYMKVRRELHVGNLI